MSQMPRMLAGIFNLTFLYGSLYILQIRKVSGEGSFKHFGLTDANLTAIQDEGDACAELARNFPQLTMLPRKFYFNIPNELHLM